jgi:metal-responsive CopG/Arc/MetJ family transcriptional regulator
MSRQKSNPIEKESEKILDNRYNRSYTSTMKTAISIPDKVFRSADALAKRLGISRSELYSTAIAEFLSRHQGRHITTRLDVIYSEENSSLSPNLIRLQAKSLAHEEW